MRIISGTYGGRKISPPGKMPYTRPTTDVAKEGLFNIIENNLSITLHKTLDLFGGTGSISFELASRGAKDLTVVEKDPEMFDFIKRTAVVLGLKNFKALKMDVFKYLDHCTETYDLIFAGPPYALASIDDIPKRIVEKNLLNNKGWFILEHTQANSYNHFPFYKTQRNYGTTIFSIFINS